MGWRECGFGSLQSGAFGGRGGEWLRLCWENRNFEMGFGARMGNTRDWLERMSSIVVERVGSWRREENVVLGG